MPTSDAQKRASAKYNKQKMKQTAVVFSPAEVNLYEHLCSQPNKSGYIKALIRADMERSKGQ